MRKIAVALSKGGVGKTTTAVNLAAGLAVQGFKVLLIDTDTQSQAARMLGVEAPAGLAELLEGEAAEKLLIEARPGLQLLAGGYRLAAAKRLIARRDMRPELVLAEALESINHGFEYVILDTAPGWDALSVNVLFYAREILSPVSLEILAVDGLANFLQSLEPIQEYQEVKLRYILPTFYDRRVKKSSEILSQLQAAFPEQLCEPIRYSVRISEAPGFGQTVFEYAARDRGAADYGRLIERVK